MVTTRRKAFHILFILHLTVATFSVAALPNVCLCGQACSHDLGEKAEARDYGTHHERCNGPDCDSCNVEKMVNLEVYMLHDELYGWCDCEGPCVVAVSADYLFNNDTLEHFDPIHSNEDADPPAIYLQNLSLLF
jgi:hypothetical protein